MPTRRRQSLTRSLDQLTRRPARAQPERDVVLDAHVRKQRVVLHHHADVARVGRQVGDVLIADPDAAGVGCTKPATARKAVVLPQPDGPISAMISPVRDVERQSLERDVRRVYATVTPSKPTPSAA